MAQCNLHLLGSSDSHASASSQVCVTHTRLIFIFLVETVFHHVGQASLELLISNDLPTLASQKAGITGLSQLTQPGPYFLHQLGVADEDTVPGVLGPTWMSTRLDAALDVESVMFRCVGLGIAVLIKGYHLWS